MTSDLLLAIDIGNTSIAIGLFDGEELAATFRIATDQDNLPDEYAMLVLALLRARGIDPGVVSAAVLSSTVPPLIQTFVHVCRNYFSVEGTLDHVPERLRPGMEGVGKIIIGERRLAWIWSRQGFDWLRLRLWAWQP